MKLLIAIPALNEEDSIENIIQRCLAARKQLIAESPVTEVQVCVVSDGSTDRTVELASQFRREIQLIVFPQNRGYGAAIKEAWKGSDADLLGFLDADGTCDPLFFGNLSRALVAANADMALGCRLNKATKMPLVRRIGNSIFAALLTAIAHARVRDTASGMRVLRPDAYRALLPLPDGLHFTPAMSARAMLGAGGGLKIVEIDMPYFERQGQSKLKVIRDGFRFLDTIFQAVFRYHPARPFLYLAGLCFVAGAALIVLAAVQHHAVGRGGAYSALVGSLGGVAEAGALMSAALGVWSQRTVETFFGAAPESHLVRVANRVTRAPWYWLIPVLTAALGLAMFPWTAAIGGIEPVPSLFDGGLRLTAAFLLFLTAFMSALNWIVQYFLNVIEDQVKHTRQREEDVTMEPAGVYVSG